MLRALTLWVLCVPLWSQDVTGRIVDQAGGPIRDAVVSLSGSPFEEPIVSTRTDADGAFDLPMPRPKKHELRVEKPGFVPLKMLVVGGGQPIDAGALTLPVDHDQRPQVAASLIDPLSEGAVKQASLCNVAQNPGQWNGRMVRIFARVRIGFEQFDVSAEDCPDRKIERVWLEYGRGPKSQPTTWCCGDLTPAGPWRLKQDADFRKFHRLLTAQRQAKDCSKPYCFANNISARLTGRFYTVGVTKWVDGEYYCRPFGGFGHLGSVCARLIIESVAEVKSTPIR